jgi:uncharacterized protein
MAEYLAPGVFIEETSFRSKSIEGVPTSTTGFAGLAPYGPVRYPDGPSTTEPRLITSFTEFERTYGGLERLTVDDGGSELTREGYLAHAARAFFANGGKRLYVSRVFAQDAASANPSGIASQQLSFAGGADSARWQARWPGSFGNALVATRPVRRRDCAWQHPVFGTQARGLGRGAVVEITAAGNPPPEPQTNVADGNLAVVDVAANGEQTFVDSAGAPAAVGPGDIIKEVVLQVQVFAGAGRRDVYEDLATHPAQRRWIAKILQRDDPEDEDAVVWLRTDAPDDPANPATLGRAVQLLVALQTEPPDPDAPLGEPPPGNRLTGGNDGRLASPDELLGLPAHPDQADAKATGLEALGEIEDIAIVALPDGGTYPDDVDRCAAAADRLLRHAEQKQYRIAVVDAPRRSSLTQVRSFRGRFDSKYGALYHPWIEILDPLEPPAAGAPPRRIPLPPSGFVSGIYARNDIERGVHKAPANEVVRGLTRFEANINTARNEVINPEGINALRFFEGRGSRVWGARTMSSDPEWKYVNVRRFFIFLERSIDLAMQWAVFEPNNERLWSNIRRTVEDFLLVQWETGALLGSTPDEAFFVRCDRTTMTQNDLDNGRLVCLIGVAPTKPAEFVIFRIGQWTADAER